MASRKNIRPLPAHIGMAASSFAQKMQTEGAVDPASMMQMSQKMGQMYTGLHAYQHHPYEAPARDYDALWHAGGTALYYKESAGKKGAVFLIPSLINGHEILDLCPQRSLAGYLCEQGYDVYLLDWGEMDCDDAALEIDELIEGRLLGASKAAEQHTKKRAKNTDVTPPIAYLGYCMGGTLLADAAARAPDQFGRLVFLAAPWDFHAGEQGLLKRVQFWAPGALPMMEQRGVLSSDWIQTLFASLDPLMAVEKFSRFSQMDQDSEEAQIFVAVEDWLNDGRDLPEQIARHCIQHWFLHNEAMRDLSAVKARSLVIASRKDRLVEFESAHSLYTALPRAELMTPDCGHIGMIAGRKAVQQVWQPLCAWLDQGDQ